MQAALVRLLSPAGDHLCAIGDPNQAIYGFRGAQPGHFVRFRECYEGVHVVRLSTTYRLTEPVLQVSEALLESPPRLRTLTRSPQVEVVACPTADSEAEQIVVRIERLLGGTSHFAIDSGRGRESEVDNLGFGDVAVLTRTKHQHAAIVGALTRSGIPYRQIAEDEPHDPRSQKVAVMTLHASKGREFEVVFVAGAERGLLPLEVEGLRCDPEEERRLLYVGVTRARSVCVLSHARKRMLFGKTLPGEVSPFLRRLPRSAVLRATASLPEKAPPSPQLDLFGSR